MEVKLPVKIEKKVVEMGKKELSKFDLIANEIVGLVLQNGRFRILDTVYRAEFYDANSSWFPFLTNILLSIRPWFYLHMATDARRKAIVYVTVVASCPMCPTYIYIYIYVQPSSFGSRCEHFVGTRSLFDFSGFSKPAKI